MKHPVPRFSRKHILIVFVFALLILVCAGCATAGQSEPIAVDNIAALRNLDGKNYSVAITAGYHRSGDGCGFTYVKDPTATKAQDNGGSVIIGNDGTCWRAVYQGPLPLKLFGAVGDGKKDDTAAIKAWLATLQNGESAYATAGIYKFTESIQFPLKMNISILGDGSQQTIFRYDGDDKNCDLFVIGSTEATLKGWVLKDFNIESKTTMKSGSALHLINMKHTLNLEDVSISRVDGINGRKLWNGVFFENCSLTTYCGFEINCQNDGILLAGKEGTDDCADILLEQGTINFTKVGIHCAGGVGGLYIGQVLIYGSTEVGYLQDNAVVARGNREIFISDQCVLDACHSYCALIDDTLSVQGTLQFNAFISGAGWIDPATPGTGLYIKSLPQGRVSIGSQHIKHCKANGIEIKDASTYVLISPTSYIVGNAGWGLYVHNGHNNVELGGFYLSNGKGDHNLR